MALLMAMSMYPCETPLSFFFSSRRRHTRSTRDWSSDVCSSDLGVLPGAEQPTRKNTAARQLVVIVRLYPTPSPARTATLGRGARARRGDPKQRPDAKIGRASCRESKERCVVQEPCDIKEGVRED